MNYQFYTFGKKDVIFILIFLFFPLLTLTQIQWTIPKQHTVLGYDYYDSVLMEPFLSRDGYWLFFNSKNVGNNVSLHYARYINESCSQYIGRLRGNANAPVPHLDAVASMDNKNNFFWIGTRDYPENIQNVLYGRFQPDGVIPIANHLTADIYIKPTNKRAWIIMDQEINEDGSILFYCNAAFENNYFEEPVFSNISIAIRATDGSYMKHPNGEKIMEKVNKLYERNIKYAPASVGKDSLELYFTARVPDDKYKSQIFVARRSGRNEPFGDPVLVPTNSSSYYVEPEAPTLSRDGKILIFNRIECEGKTCPYNKLYYINKIQ